MLLCKARDTCSIDGVWGVPAATDSFRPQIAHCCHRLLARSELAQRTGGPVWGL